MGEARMYHSSAVLLPDGRVVIGGGEAGGRLRAQIYSPPYLFKGTRPTSGARPRGVRDDLGHEPGRSAITSVALLRPSAATHAFDMNQRYVPLSFTRSGNMLTVTGPPLVGWLRLARTSLC